MKNNALILLVAGSVSACMAFSTRPAWIDGVGQQYSEKDYLIASGSADREEDAKNRALANLARIFEVRIDDTSIDRNYVNVEQTDSVMKRLNTQTAVRYVDAYTYKQLEGAQIVEQWLDKRSGQHYALAAISRKSMLDRLRADIMQADAAVNEYMLRSKHALDPIKSANLVFMAQHALKDREKLQRDLLIVDVERKLHDGYAWMPERVETQLSLTLSSIVVNVEVSTEAAGELRSMLQSAATHAGLTVSDDAPGYSLQGLLEVENLGKQQGWFWYRGILEIKLLDVQNKKVRKQKRWPIKASGATPEQAKLRLNSNVLSLLNKELRKVIISTNG